MTVESIGCKVCRVGVAHVDGGGRRRRVVLSAVGGCSASGEWMLLVQADLLLRVIGRLSRAATGDVTAEVLLRELCAVTAEAFEVDGVGVMTAVPEWDGTIRFVDARGGPRIVAVEQLQEIFEEGPCQDAVGSGQPVAVSDLRADRRWPRYTPAVLALNIRSVLAVPLISRGLSWGSLDLYRRAGAWTMPEVDAARLLADVAVSYVVMAADRDAARGAQSQLSIVAVTDQLTGLPNRTLLVDRMVHALAVGRRTGRVNAAVALDLDRFKTVNDSYGRADGDRVLVEVAHRLSSALRAGDTLARVGGDQFVVFCEDLPGQGEREVQASVAAITDRLRAVLAYPFQVNGTDLRVSASVGAALAGAGLTGVGVTEAELTGDAFSTVEDLLAAADTAVGQAKQQGRDRVVVSDPTVTAAAQVTRALDRDLMGALDRGEFAVYYQPIVDAADRTVRAVEALLRWEHPMYGLLPAAAFITVAAANGTLPRIGRWVLARACAQLDIWAHQPDARPPDIVFCNLSPRELTDPALPGAVDAALASYDLSPDHLGLEIVEAGFADPLLAPLLTPYHLSGHPLAVDDFGTGYSSLSRLVHLTVDYAKIDRSFIAGLPDDPRSRALVDAVLTVAATLGLQVIAEGIESQAQADYLTAAGCPLLQGFHLGRPMPAAQLGELLTPVA